MRVSTPARAWTGAAAALFAVGWGANQFTSLLLAYRQHAHIGATTGDALFGVYALGLIPALLIGGRLSDRHGRRMVIPVVAVSAVATAVLMLGGGVGLPALYVGRGLAGVVSGLAFAPGTAWVKELSSPPWGDTTDGHIGARRAAIALTAGFGAGPLVAGMLAQWAPYPTVIPYVPHLLIVAAIARGVLATPETVAAPSAPARTPAAPPLTAPPPVAPPRTEPPTVAPARAGGAGRFGRIAGPMAPWVFAAPSIAFAVLPAQVTRHTGRYQVLFAAVIAGLTLFVGVLVQGAARRLDTRAEALGAPVGLAVVTAGLVTGAAAAATSQPLLVVAASVALGAGYGTCLVSGLLEVQRVAPPGGLAGLTAAFYALTYIGFGAPVLISALSAVAAPAVLLLAGAGGCLLTLAVVSAGRRRLGGGRLGAGPGRGGAARRHIPSAGAIAVPVPVQRGEELHHRPD